MLSAYASIGDAGLSFALYLGLVSLNLAAHSAAQALAAAGGAGAAEGRGAARHGRARCGVSAQAAGRERSLAAPVRRARGSFLDYPE